MGARPRGTRLLQGALLALAGLALVVAIGLGIYLSSRDWGAYRDSIANQLSLAFGRPVHIDGELELSLLPRPELHAHELRAMGPTGEGEPLMRIGSVELLVSLRQLASGVLRFDRLEMRDVRVLLAVDEEGRSSWSLEDEEPQEDVEFDFDSSLEGKRGVVENAEIVYRDDLCESSSRILLDRVEIERVGDELDVKARGSADGVPFELAGSADPLTRLLSSRAPFSIDLEGDAEGVAIEVTGQIAQPGDLTGIDLRLRARAPTTRFLERHVDLRIPDLGPLDLTARLRDEAGRLRSEMVDLHIGDRNHTWLRLQGDLRSRECGVGLTLAGSFGAVDLDRLESLLPAELHEIGTLEGSFELDDRDGSLGLERFDFRASSEGVVSARLQGSFDDLSEFDELEFEARIEAADLSALGLLAGRTLPPVGPIEIDVNAEGSDEHAQISRGHLRVGSSVFDLRLEGSYAAGERPRMEGVVRSDHVQLDDFSALLEPGSDEAQPPPQVLFPREPLELDGMRAFDTTIDFHADRVSGPAGLDLDDLSARIRLEEGSLTIAPVEMVYQTGRIDASTKLAAPETGAVTTSVDATAYGVDVKRLLSQFQEDPALSGRADARIRLDGIGSSAHDLASSLDGRVTLMIENGTIDADYANALTVDLIDKLSSGTATHEHIPLHCLFADLEVVQGVVQVRTLVLDSDDVTLEGEGSIDLRRERIDLDITPSPKDPSVLGLTAPVRVEGSLLEPEVAVRGLDMLVESAQDMATGAVQPALRWIEQLWSDDEQSSACEALMGDRPASSETGRRS